MERVTAVGLDRTLPVVASERVKVWGLDSRIRLVVGEATTASWTDTPADRVVALDSDLLLRIPERPSCGGVPRPCVRECVLAVTDLLQGEGSPCSPGPCGGNRSSGPGGRRPDRGPLPGVAHGARLRRHRGPVTARTRFWEASPGGSRAGGIGRRPALPRTTGSGSRSPVWPRGFTWGSDPRVYDTS